MEAALPAAKTSYGEILKSSSMIGGSAAINLIVSMARAKAGAIFLGTSGVGLLNLYFSAQLMLRTLTGLGINSSGVREVAAATGVGDHERIGRTVGVLRKACWATGLLGWAFAALFAWPISQWTFGNPDHAWAIGAIGATLLLGSISGGQMAVVQGMRRIRDLAAFNISSAVLSAVASIACFWLFGINGIVPAIIITGVLTLLASWWFVRRVDIPQGATITFLTAIKESKPLIGMGMAFMWSGLLQSLATLIKSSLVVRQLGLEANGIYAAAWSISGLFASYILSSMGADFYPRLTAASKDDAEMSRLVNEQTEIGILLALPALLGTLIFAPLAITLFYSSAFSDASTLLQWFVLGMFGRVTSWPMGFTMLAKGKATMFATAETLSNSLHLALAVAGLFTFGLVGIPVAFFFLYVLYNVAMLAVSRHLCGFVWSGPVVRLIGVSATLVVICFIVRQTLPDHIAIVVGGSLTLASALFCIRGLALRIGEDHRLVRMAFRVPGIRKVTVIRTPWCRTARKEKE